MTDEEIRLESAKLAVQVFVGMNGDRHWSSFAGNVSVIYNYIKYGVIPNGEFLGIVDVARSSQKEVRAKECEYGCDS